MRNTKLFLFVSLLLVKCHALPRKNLDDTQSAIVSINAKDEGDHGFSGDLLRQDHEENVDSRHPIALNKPRVLVSYGNVYKQPTVDPMQNLLMYFLMNVARDFVQDQDQFERRRSFGFLNTARTAASEAGEKIVNGTKKVSQKVGNVLKTITSRDIPLESQYEESHYFPHVDGTCMCIKRLISHGPLELKNDNIKDSVIYEKVKENESLTDVRNKYFTNAQLKVVKATELKTENHNVPNIKEKSTVSIEGNNEMKNNNSTVRVLKVLDLDNLEDNNKVVMDMSTTQKQSVVVV